MARVAEVARPAYELAAARGDAWSRAELAHWLWRAGEPVEPAPDDPEPYARAVAGDWAGAADAWARLGFAYDRAEALSDAEDDDARLDALGALRGARRAALGRQPAAAAAGGGRAADPARPARRVAGGAGGADAPRDRGAGPDRAGRHQRGDRAGAGDLAEDRGPPRLGRARQARRRLPARGRGRRRAAGASGASRPRPGTPTRTAPGSRCRGCARRRTRRARSRTRPRGRPCARSPGPRSSARSAA